MSPTDDTGRGGLREARVRRAITAVVLFTLLLALLLACSCAVGSIFVARSSVSDSSIDHRVLARIVGEGE